MGLTSSQGYDGTTLSPFVAFAFRHSIRLFLQHLPHSLQDLVRKAPVSHVLHSLLQPIAKPYSSSKFFACRFGGFVVAGFHGRSACFSRLQRSYGRLGSLRRCRRDGFKHLTQHKGVTCFRNNRKASQTLLNRCKSPKVNPKRSKTIQKRQKTSESDEEVRYD